MTFRQKILKTFYPVLMKLNKTSAKNSKKITNKDEIKPVAPFYSLSTTDIRGAEINFSRFEGKKTIIVNTASDCGYTAQYSELQELYNSSEGKFNLLGFPSNDFSKQEKGNDEAIAEFCKTNYNIKFPLMKKSIVIKKTGQNEIYEWLTDPGKNGWNSQQPDWNFSKYIINEEGILTHYFGPAVSPLGEEIKSALE